MISRTNLRQSYELFSNLTQRELKGKYKRTVLGQLWSLANPIALMLVYTFVFAFVVRIKLPEGEPSGLSSFPLWLLAGLLPWVFFSGVILHGMNTLIANEALIRKVFFPRNILIFSSVAALATNWSVEMLVLVLLLILVGSFGLLPLLPVVAFIMLLLIVFSAGLALMLSIANVYFRDTEYLVGIGLQLGMYLSPVVYPVSLVADESNKVGPIIGNFTILDIYSFNPMVHFLNAFRSVLYDNALPNLSEFVICIFWALLALLIGWLVFSNNQKKLAEIL